MKFKTLALAFLMGLSAPLFAANKHFHSSAENATSETTEQTKAQTKMGWPGYCEIEIINHSYDDVRVYGVYDDGVALNPFTVYSYESPHYISLYYYGYCHSGMDLYIDTLYGAHVYSGYVSRYSTIRIVPSMFGGKLEAKVQSK
jgi:hypothetical protein